MLSRASTAVVHPTTLKCDLYVLDVGVASGYAVLDPVVVVVDVVRTGTGGPFGG